MTAGTGVAAVVCTQFAPKPSYLTILSGSVYNRSRSRSRSVDQYRRGSFQQAYSPQSNGYRQYSDRGKNKLFSPLQLANRIPLLGGSFDGRSFRSSFRDYGRAGGSQWSPVSGRGNIFSPLLVLMVDLRFQAAPLIVRVHWKVVHRAVLSGLTGLNITARVVVVAEVIFFYPLPILTVEPYFQETPPTMGAHVGVLEVIIQRMIPNEITASTRMMAEVKLHIRS